MINGRLQVVPVDTGENIAPAGGVNSSALDMAKWIRIQLAPPLVLRHRPLLLRSVDIRS